MGAPRGNGFLFAPLGADRTTELGAGLAQLDGTHFAEVPSSSLLKHLLKREGDAAEWHTAADLPSNVVVAVRPAVYVPGEVKTANPRNSKSCYASS